jgi:hypothetical protein
LSSTSRRLNRPDLTQRPSSRRRFCCVTSALPTTAQTDSGCVLSYKRSRSTGNADPGQDRWQTPW